MKRILCVVILSLILCSCSKQTDNLPSETKNTTLAISQQTPEQNLPINFTIEKVKSALLEYINYRLYLYPVSIMDATSDKDMDNYIGKSVNIEIRVYNNSSEKMVYAHTSAGEWLAIFRYKDGFIYCDGQTSESEYAWPENIEDYEVIEKYSIVIPEPHKPNYGTSERKNKMIAAFESKIKSQCSEYYEHATEEYHIDWENLNVYIADFYEWENAAHAWLCSQDGSMTAYPVYFEEQDDGFYVQALKGYTMESKNQFNKFGLHQFEKDIEDAVLHFKCNVK